MKYIKFYRLTSLLMALSLVVACEKEDNGSSDNQIFLEEAFPGMSGDTVLVELDGSLITCELINGLYIYQGDIILTPDLKKTTSGAGLTDVSIRWPYGVVYYNINRGIANQEKFLEAMKEWETKTDIVFLERTDQENYIEFMPDANSNYSYLGMIGGRQEIHICDRGNVGTVIHEIGHAMGLIHEHSRPNRDSYVKINWDNIVPDKKYAFEIHSRCISTEGFDFNSVMLYPPYAFSINQQPTITREDGSLYTVQRSYLSDEDVEVISKMYSDLHDAVFVNSFGDSPANVHITSDGTYYYTIMDGSVDVGRINKFNLQGQRLGSYFFSELKGRGLSYNKSDGYLYASVFGGDIVKITDLENGTFTKIYDGIMQHEDASFALSDDGEKLYDFYNGTLKIYDFVNGELMKTITGLSCGDEPYYGAAAVAVDVTYIYTWDMDNQTVYVYNHDGVFQRTLTSPSGYFGRNGMSLSAIDGLLLFAGNPRYDPGYWYVFNIRRPVEEQ